MLTWNDMVDMPSPLKTEGVDVLRVSLGKNTYNTCNPGIGDADGDGLDEIAIPVIENDQCRVDLYDGQGELRWRNDESSFFNYYYNDMESYKGSHWHARTKHRHLFTRIFDFDGDGKSEVVVADGPVYILDALTGEIKSTIDLNAHVQVWCPARIFGSDRPPAIVAGIEKRGGGCAIIAIDNTSKVVWETEAPGRLFYDAIWAGDVDEDGIDEIVFSIHTEGSMFLADAKGRIRWRKNVREEIGEDSHIDDLVIDEVQPGSKQILMATGPALIDKNGGVLWTRGEDYDHAQRVLAVPRGSDLQGKNAYFCESYEIRSFLLDSEGKEIWRFDGYEKSKPEFADSVRFRLTTAGSLMNRGGRPYIVQGIMGGYRGQEEVTGQAQHVATVLDVDGNVAAHLPFEDQIRGSAAMCALNGHFRPIDLDCVLIITHHDSSFYIFQLPEK
jgi:outer membrane protein assembly factor BamB